jgi:hypothetical protein
MPHLKKISRYLPWEEENRENLWRWSYSCGLSACEPDLAGNRTPAVQSASCCFPKWDTPAHSAFLGVKYLFNVLLFSSMKMLREYSWNMLPILAYLKCSKWFVYFLFGGSMSEYLSTDQILYFFSLLHTCCKHWAERFYNLFDYKISITFHNFTIFLPQFL